ncbi:alpha/beta fold hydrolase [Microbulbifer sp. OS29]|uniref:Alpha/beta fold hydrolase n=1 Tax=Microbulbifer okhotskensis TaxID=2926617 RepID=A0A9X2EVG7_9GAMM|nr:alpha/beta fold hydrolase [Microbulbifer okhotskensis]MCO1336681.1 alpha/beta fold hydrolase [Microbulbifer okhotskensis]
MKSINSVSAKIESRREAFITFDSVSLSDKKRGQTLKVRITAPVAGNDLPIVIFAHGYQSPSFGYAPLVEYLASSGFVVLQPIFLDSSSSGLSLDDSRTSEIWQYRVSDMTNTLDQLDRIEKTVPSLQGRLDKERIVAIGHSYGAQTVGMLLGARVLGADNKPGLDMSDVRIKAGVLLCAPGMGGENLSPFAAEHFSFMNPSFTEMVHPSLVVAADQDDSPLSIRGPDWFTDAFTLGVGAEYLLTLTGAKHLLGGINGYGVIDREDNNPDHIAVLQVMITAYLQKKLYGEEAAWRAALAVLSTTECAVGRIDEKPPVQ